MQRIDRWAIAAVGVLFILACAWWMVDTARPPVTVDEHEAPRSAPAPAVLTLYANGHVRCSCVPVPDGCYTAKHCFQGLRSTASLTLDGVPVRAYSVDPARDLAHIPQGANPRQLIGVPADDALGVWRGQRTGIARLAVAGAVMGPFNFTEMRILIDRQPFDRWAVGTTFFPTVIRWDDEGPIRPGDSGGGFFVDGVLVGILSMSGGYTASTVRVP